MKKSQAIQDKLWMMTLIILAVSSLLAVCRSIFFGLDVDEQYAVSLAYRLANGDMLIKEMWEPHQTSAILPALFIKIYTAVRGNADYLVIYLRILGAAAQLGVSVFWYQTLKQQFDKKICLLTAIIFFHTLPKWLQTPEFANMQIWFLTLVFLCLFRYEKNGKNRYCVAAGIAMALEVLAYPSCILIFPVYAVWLWKKGKEGKRSFLFFGGTCAACGFAFLLYLLSYMGIGELGQNMGHVLGDGSHSAGIGEKIVSYGLEILGLLPYIAAYIMIAGLFAIVFVKDKKNRGHVFGIALLTVASLDQIRCWTVNHAPAIYPQSRYLLLFIMGIFLWYKAKNKGRENWNSLIGLAWIPSAVAFAAVLLLTNLGVRTSLAHLAPGMLCTFLMWGDAVRGEEMQTEVPEEKRKKIAGSVVALVVFWALTLIGSRGYLIRDNEGIYKDPFYVKQKALYGAAKGVYATWLVGDRYNQNYELLNRELTPEDKLLYVGNETLIYLMTEAEISGASTISTPTFDENYIAYFENNPHKIPTVIAVDPAFCLNNPDKIPVLMAWIEDNYDWENRVETDYLWLVRQ